jgi:hypothetical protein
MDSENEDKDWKLKLRYGKLKTPFQHFTLIAEGKVAGGLKEGFSCPKGSAFMAMKVWATSSDEASHMIGVLGEHIGFDVNGRIQVYETEPASPPRDSPYGYDINFTPFNSKLDS